MKRLAAKSLQPTNLGKSRIKISCFITVHFYSGVYGFLYLNCYQTEYRNPYIKHSTKERRKIQFPSIREMENVPYETRLQMNSRKTYRNKWIQLESSEINARENDFDRAGLPSAIFPIDLVFARERQRINCKISTTAHEKSTMNRLRKKLKCTLIENEKKKKQIELLFRQLRNCRRGVIISDHSISDSRYAWLVATKCLEISNFRVLIAGKRDQTTIKMRSNRNQEDKQKPENRSFHEFL